MIVDFDYWNAGSILDSQGPNPRRIPFLLSQIPVMITVSPSLRNLRSC